MTPQCWKKSSYVDKDTPSTSIIFFDSSTGTFAVISLMVGKVVISYSYQYSDSSMAQQAGYSAIEVATLVCFIVGVIQVTTNKLLIREV